MSTTRCHGQTADSRRPSRATTRGARPTPQDAGRGTHPRGGRIPPAAAPSGPAASASTRPCPRCRASGPLEPGPSAVEVGAVQDRDAHEGRAGLLRQLAQEQVVLQPSRDGLRHERRVALRGALQGADLDADPHLSLLLALGREGEWGGFCEMPASAAIARYASYIVHRVQAGATVIAALVMRDHLASAVPAPPPNTSIVLKGIVIVHQDSTSCSPVSGWTWTSS